jgi:hypothetical protein
MWQRWVEATKIFEKSSDNGASWTPLGLDASIITQGKIHPDRLPVATLPANVAYKDVNNFFSTDQTVYGHLTSSGNTQFNGALTLGGHAQLNSTCNVGGDIQVAGGLIRTYPAPTRRIELDTGHVYERYRRTYKLIVSGFPHGSTARLFTQESYYVGNFINLIWGFQGGWNKNFAARVVLDGYGVNNNLLLIAGEAAAFAWAIENTEPGRCSLMIQNLTGVQVEMQAVVECLSWTANTGVTSAYMQY